MSTTTPSTETTDDNFFQGRWLSARSTEDVINNPVDITLGFLEFTRTRVMRKGRDSRRAYVRNNLDRSRATSNLESERLSSPVYSGRKDSGEDLSNISWRAGGHPRIGEKDMIAEEKTGIIVRIDDRAGFGYVCVENSTKKYFFDFESIPGYRGQSARELKLRQGGRVRFQVQGEIVKSLIPLEPMRS